jgi:hypothetical protein
MVVTGSIAVTSGKTKIFVAIIIKYFFCHEDGTV